MADANGFLLAVEHWVRESPSRVAYRAFDGTTMTYGELWQLSDAIAIALAARLGGHAAAQLPGCESAALSTGNREPVMVLGHKSKLMVASFLGCLKSGHAFVPVDGEMPESRLADIACQLGHPVLLAAGDVPETLRVRVPESRMMDARVAAAQPFDAASVPARSCWVAGEETQYVIFTSGSTGRPKGIEVSASNVEHFMEWVCTFPVVAEGGRTFLDQPPYSFDLSEYEVVGALSTGGCLCATTREETENLRVLFAGLRTSGVQVWVSTPSFADLCLVDKSFNKDLLPNVRLFLFCGEALHHGTAEALLARFPQARVANTYGPTESTVAVTYGEIGPEQLADSAPLPVGWPRRGTSLRIVHPETGAPCEVGQVGEIVIVGDTVAKGYFRDAQKTAAAFSCERLADGRVVRSYRTGDAGHLDERGGLHCDGRFDTLVKLNGFRIELEDVEENLAALSQVKQAAVIPVRRHGRLSHLKACVVLNEASGLQGFAARQAIKQGLAERVPSYMVPRAVKLLKELPLTCNGKVDRKALAED